MPARFAALICLAMLAMSCQCTDSASAVDQFPYTTQVLGNEAYVRSGPGRNFYPTDKLKPGASVEVYRHDPGGWCAIRPPAGSFSWVSARYVELIDDELGEVTVDQVVARVGSQLSNVRDVIQVRLNAGERVAILDEYTSGSQSWYKVAAPAGEFRWIRQSLVNTPDVAGDSLDSVPNNTTPPVETTPQILIQEETEQTGEAGPTGFQPAGYDSPATPAANAATAENRPVATSRESTAATVPAAARQFDFASEVAAIELRISQLVAEEPTLWVFDDLEQRVADLDAASGTAGERQLAKGLQQKLERMAEIHDRFEQVGSVVDTSDRQMLSAAQPPALQVPPQESASSTDFGDVGAPNSPNSSDTRVPPVAAIDRKFDAQGVLRPVVSRRTDAPRYALVDEAGTVLSFLTPAPGMNLQPHLGARLGIVGTRGYLSDLRKPHLMVKRIVVLAAPAN